MLRQDDFLKSQLVLTGWLYGQQYGGWRAAAMVMSVLMNRVRLGWGTLLDVLEKMPKYAATEEIPTGNSIASASSSCQEIAAARFF